MGKMYDFRGIFLEVKPEIFIETQIMLFWIVTPCNPVGKTTASEECVAFIYRAKVSIRLQDYTVPQHRRPQSEKSSQ
jgi:hypothetical protein